MYDVKQFKPALYILLALGFAGFCLSVGAPTLFLLAIALLSYNAWRVRTDRFQPAPRWLVNIVTILAVVYVGSKMIRGSAAVAIIPIGEFLILLQLIKLYEQRSNRDYAQLLVLSLLLIVAAMISSGSLLLGLITIAHLLLSLYCCLLFHLKVETDHAREQMGLDEKRISPMTLRQDQRFLNKSMTRLTGFVSLVAIGMSVFVFLFFPRLPSGSLLGMPSLNPTQAQTGFSENVDFQGVSRIAQNNAIVAYIDIQRNGEPAPLGYYYFRGQTYDDYDNDPESRTRYTWRRDRRSALDQQRNASAQREELLVDPQPGADFWNVTFRELKPTGTNILFGMGWPTSIRIDSATRNLPILFQVSDGIIVASEPLRGSTRYTLTAQDLLPAYTAEGLRIDTPDGKPRQFAATPAGQLEKLRYQLEIHPDRIDPLIREYALRASREPDGAELHPLVQPGLATDVNERIAGNIERFLLSKEYSYTLDLTTTRSVNDVGDPVALFLDKWKKGHCEYFASSMVLMCQSLGVPARLVTGFKVDEFNNVGGYWVMRESQAHAWVEVLTPRGWIRFDPTNSGESATVAAQPGFWKSVGNFFEYLDQAWASNVVAYDASSRTSLLERVEGQMQNSVARTSNLLSDSKSNLGSFKSLNLYSISSLIILVSLVLLGVGLAIAVGVYLFQQWQLRRRAHRIGLGELDPNTQIALARQLGFFDQLVRNLERRNVKRQPHQTPLEFSQSLSFLPAESHRMIVRLTELFYRIRFGQLQVKPDLRRRLTKLVDRLEDKLG
jgi:protein-glutamine gamma-glutamyltransferase